MVQDYRQEQEHRELRADLRAYRVWDACRGIAMGLGGKPDSVKPEDVFPSLRALKVVESAVNANSTNDIDADEDIAMASFQQLRRGFRV